MQNIKIIKGNNFTTSCQTIVNTINCIGVMGAGIALEFRYRYPMMYKNYVEFCNAGKIHIGTLWLYNKEQDRKWVLNFPTKNNWKYETKPEYLEKGLNKFLETHKDKGITSIAFPLLGADKGGLNPEVSLSIMERYLSLCEIPVEIYKYDPYAGDDLIDLAREIFTLDKLPGLSKRTSLDIKSLTKIQKELSDNSINSLFQLTKVKGIGDTTIEKCFQFVINQKLKPKYAEQNLFSVHSIVEEPKNDTKIQENKEDISEPES